MNGFKANEKASQACILYLFTKCWQGAKVLDPDVMKRLGSSEWLHGRKSLVDPKLLDPIRAAQNQAHRLLGKLSLPFPIKALNLMPKGLLEHAEALLTKCKSDYWENVETFLDQYAQAREEAKDNLGEYFDDEDYPADIRAKFGFMWQYLHLGAPSEVNVLDYDMFVREKRKFEGMMEEARDMATKALREEFADLVKHAKERLTGDKDGAPKIFRNSMVENFKEFFSTFNERNSLFNDDRLANLVAQAKNVLSGVEADDIRTNASLRGMIRRTMEEVGAEVDKALVDAPVRKIRFVGAVEKAA